MIMVKLFTGQKDSLIGKLFDDHQFFNPVENIDGDWFISETEAESKEFDFSSNERIEFVPKEINPII